MGDMRKRLIELILNAPRKGVVYGDIKLDKPVQTAQSIADYLLANGVIVPPCNVGDILYDIFDDKNIKEIKVTEINIRFDKRNKAWLIIGGYYYSFDEFGKTVFLTKEEAEQALKGRGADG